MPTLMKKHKRWLYPLLAFAAFAPISPAADIATANYFYTLGGGSLNHFVNTPFLKAIYDYGTLPELMIAAGASLFLILGYLLTPIAPLRRQATLLLLTMAIGSGFITNALLKEYWNRPRPTQVDQFGGLQPFRPFYSPNFFSSPEPSKSFPCGHCTTGFFFFALALIGRRSGKKGVEVSGYLLALLFGITLGVTRMAQGGHFLSDVIAGALVMWWTALIFDWLIYADLVDEQQATAS